MPAVFRDLRFAVRTHVVSQLLVESLLLSLSGGALGLWIATMTTESLLRLAPDG